MKFTCLSFCLSVCRSVHLSVCLSALCMHVSLYAHNIVVVTPLGIYILFTGPFLTTHLLLSKSDLCLSLLTGRPESAEASHFDGGNCHCRIWNLLGA